MFVQMLLGNVYRFVVALVASVMIFAAGVVATNAAHTMTATLQDARIQTNVAVSVGTRN